MSPSVLLLFIFLDFRTEPRVVDAGAPETEAEAEAETKDFLSPERNFPNWFERAKVPTRFARGTKSRSSGEDAEPSSPGGGPRGPQSPLRSGAEGAQRANGSSERRSGLFNPLYPLTGGSCWAYALLVLALLLLAAGVLANLALMCAVWHRAHLKSAWNCVLAGLALWDFLVLFFCLPVVVSHELSVKRLLGDLSCRLVPYLEVSSVGVATFSLCALSIERFNAAVAPGPPAKARLQPCRSILPKLAIIWGGSMLLAAPELLLWRLVQEAVGPLAPPAYLQQNQLGGTLIAALRTGPETVRVDVCVRQPSPELSDGVFSLVLTYQQARRWWFLGCYVCLPLLFSLACDLLTRQVSAQRLPPQDGGGKDGSGSSSVSSAPRRERRLRSSLLALAGLHAACGAPESLASVVLSAVSGLGGAEPGWALPALGLLGQLLLFLRCALTPVLMLSLCPSLGQAFLDCCCCCCQECVQDGGSAPSFSSSTTVTSPSASPTSLSPSSHHELKAVVPGRLTSPSVGVGTPC